jgi:hypothetical protein
LVARCACLLAFFLLSAPSAFAVFTKEDAATTPTRAQLEPTWDLASEYIRIELAFDGLYRVAVRDLLAAGMPATVDPRALALWNHGQLVPIHVNSRLPDRLSPDDSIEFIGAPAAGTWSTWMPDNYYNVYFLTWNGGRTLRYAETTLAQPSIPSDDLSFWHFCHLEEDNYYRESQMPRGYTDNFYWCHVAAGVSGTFPIRLDFPDIDTRYARSVRLLLHIFGYSDVPGLKPQHKFTVLYGDDDPSAPPAFNLGTFEFNHRGYYDFETSLPVSRIGFRQRLLFATPPDRQNVVDAISFDWVRIWYPRKLEAGQHHWYVFNSNLCTRANPPYSFAVRHVGRRARVFCPAQRCVYLPQRPDSDRIVVRADDRQTTFFLVTEEAVLPVESLEFRHRPRLAEAVSTGTESLLLYDPELSEAVGRTISYRQTTGPKTAAVNVRDIFDATNYGFISDVALKRFLRYAAANVPTLRYLVLYGDSTQDYRLAMPEDYDRVDPPRVGLPIHWIENPATIRTGGYVDDNWFASFKSANTPDLATGRIPAANNDQANEYVRKFIEYETFQASRNDRMLLVSSVEARFHDLAGAVQEQFRDHFTTITLLFPETSVATREVQRLREAIDGGVQLLYYLGHGGAFVWRVGPVDFAKQKDLFTPADVAQLRNALHYPIIIASSCYTTAFDADYSIGEAFILQPRAGAIAVVGSPWKSSAYEDHAFNVRFLSNYCQPGFVRLGDAYQATKEGQRPRDDSYVDTQTFTLLGDPTLKLVPRK